MPKFVSIEEAVKLIPDGASVMFGGFMGCGNAHRFVDALSKSGVKDLTMICNDASFAGGPMGEEFYGVAKLVHNHQIKKLIATHVGLNPEVATQSMQEGTLEVILLPQGSFAEMIRAQGAGLGGVLTPTGVGTITEGFEYVHSKVNIDGKDYLLLKPLKADFAVIEGFKVDKAGNICYHGTARNFCPLMATAAKTVIVEAETLLEIGEIDPDNVVTPGIFVDYIVYDGGNK